MYQNYNNYYPQQTQQGQAGFGRMPAAAQPQGGLKGRPVSSLEEVRATSIDFDGSVFYFPDLANKKIYTKQINMDGTASLYMYELKEIPTVDQNNNSYITREEFENVINQLKMGFQQQAPVFQQPKKEEAMTF